jgi:hypothetical protein
MQQAGGVAATWLNMTFNNEKPHSFEQGCKGNYFSGFYYRLPL